MEHRISMDLSGIFEKNLPPTLRPGKGVQKSERRAVLRPSRSACSISQTRERLPGQRLGFIDLDRDLRGTAEADPNVSVVLEDVQPARDGVAHPEGLLTDAFDRQRRRRLLFALGRP